jgi:hypothetical protein
MHNPFFKPPRCVVNRSAAIAYPCRLPFRYIAQGVDHVEVCLA